MNSKLDQFLRRHPYLFMVVVLLLTTAAIIVLLGGLQDVGLVYKAF